MLAEERLTRLAEQVLQLQPRLLAAAALLPVMPGSTAGSTLEVFQPQPRLVCVDTPIRSDRLMPGGYHRAMLRYHRRAMPPLGGIQGLRRATWAVRPAETRQLS